MTPAVADEDVAFLPLFEVARLIREGMLTSVAVTRLMLDRIERLNPALNGYITVTGESALVQAEGLDRLREAGTCLGPLHGVPVAVKDNIATAGVRTTLASRIYADWVPDEDATVVERLKQGGAVILGKANLYEFAFGGVHEDFGESRNPWDQTRSCSASSCGPACVVAAGLAYASLGTDTGGSIRLPAAACGLFGLKGTYGSVSRAGLVPGGYSLDTIGPLTRSVLDAGLVQQVVAGFDARDPASSPRTSDCTAGLNAGIKGLTIGVPGPQADERLNPEMSEAFEAALVVLRAEGATLVTIDLPDHLLSRTIMWAVAASEMAEAHHATLRERPQDYSPTVLGHLRQGAFLSATDYIRAQRLRRKIVTEYQEVMTRVDAVVMPVVPFPAWTIGDDQVVVDGVPEDLMAALTRYCPPFNITGQPAISVPSGFTSGGLPLAFQIAGRWHDEAMVLRIAQAYASATDWSNRRPPLAA
jgi:aspartyl-tRNA(Asn)/glutamyl-tRNA(Gln) amidotransferase subunit A